MKRTLPILFVTLLLATCKGPEDPVVEPLHPEPPLEILQPRNDDQFIVGEDVIVKLKISDPAKVRDLQLFVSDTLYAGNLGSQTDEVAIKTENGRVGFVKISVQYTDDKGELRGDYRTVVFFSDIRPVPKTAVVQRVLPHETGSYTQGLEFYKGALYEGTGQMGSSVLAEINLETGKQTRVHALDGQYFGEGITILDDTIYQITWQNNTCFVYDLNFNLVRQMSYTGEGWGLCNDGASLIMTNGTSEVVWRDPHTFRVEKRIWVFRDEDSVESLNEIELIDGRLFANVYGEKYLVEIDTATGKVLSEIDCRNIVKEGKVPGADVLNGIAYNPATGKIYITGKWWPKLFEVTFE